MARSLSSAKLLSAIVVDVVVSCSNITARRAYAAGANVGAGAGAGGARGGLKNVMVKKGAGDKKEMDVVRSAKQVSWAPDPKTGYYRPENIAAEMDVAELRAMFLRHR